MTASYRVKLTDIFEGPMDLLVYLIKKNEVDIYDIPVAVITDQFLDYIKLMKSLNIDVAGEFLVMAATLVHIKSKMLLPVHEPDDDEDPRLEIVRPLSEYLKMKSAAESLASRPILGEETFVRPFVKELLPEDEEEVVQVGLFELIDAFQKILEKTEGEQSFKITADRISVKERISQIIDLLEKKESIAFMELFDKSPSRQMLIATFLALLEMAKLNLIRIYQHVKSSTIRIIYI